MRDHLFLSYSSADGENLALQLADELSGGRPPFPVWVDKRKLRSGFEDWDEQIVEAIRNCSGLLFLMTEDSVQPLSVCKNEWVRALKYKKPIIPLLARADVELPFRLGSREYIDVTGPFETAIARIRTQLKWLNSPEGHLQNLKYRLTDAKRELQRAEPEQQTRIKNDMAELERLIVQQQSILNDPVGAEQRVQQSIERALELVREPAKPVTVAKQAKFINPPPSVAPTWFQDRHSESEQIGNFLKNEAMRLMTVVGRGGIGKSALVCRLLKSLESGLLPDDKGPLAVDGVLYLSNARLFHRVTVPELHAGLRRLLPDEMAARHESLYKNPQTSTRETFEALLQEFTSGRTIVLLDNFEDAVDAETGKTNDQDLHEALRVLVELPSHGLKTIITTRVFPADLGTIEPSRQRRLNLDQGLEHPYAENVLRAMDSDGTLGLLNAPDPLLDEARKRTRGNPRALEHLYGILSADRDTTLGDILEDTKQLLPEKVIEVLVGEAFSRLEPTAQLVMQALSIYRYPVPAAAVDYLLQPHVPGVSSALVLQKLVNMQFARREAGRYYVHQVDRDYALGRIPEGAPGDQKSVAPILTRYALTHRAAEWFKKARKTREDWKILDDLAPQLSEYELRFAIGEYDEAAALLVEIDFDYLILWGHFRLAADLHQRLQGRITDPILTRTSAGNLGTALYRLGQYQEALSSYELALSLSLQHGARDVETSVLGNLGTVWSDLGETSRAIDYHERALAISRQAGYRRFEASALGNLANAYSNSGRIDEAVEYGLLALAIDNKIGDTQNQALDMNNLALAHFGLGNEAEGLRCILEAHRLAQESRFRLIEVSALAFLGEFYVLQGATAQGIEQLQRSVELADEIASNQGQNEGRQILALAHLYRNELAEARDIAEASKRFKFPLNDHEASLALGVIALRQGDVVAAREALTAAVNHADVLLKRNPKAFGALDVKGLALCGLALCERAEHLHAAIEAFDAARAITSAAGIIKRTLKLFDALAQADEKGILHSVRAAAAGHRTTIQ